MTTPGWSDEKIKNDENAPPPNPVVYRLFPGHFVGGDTTTRADACGFLSGPQK